MKRSGWSIDENQVELHSREFFGQATEPGGFVGTVFLHERAMEELCCPPEAMSGEALTSDIEVISAVIDNEMSGLVEPEPLQQGRHHDGGGARTKLQDDARPILLDSLEQGLGGEAVEGNAA